MTSNENDTGPAKPCWFGKFINEYSIRALASHPSTYAANVSNFFMILRDAHQVLEVLENPPFVCVHYSMLMEDTFSFTFHARSDLTQ